MKITLTQTVEYNKALGARGEAQAEEIRKLRESVQNLKHMNDALTMNNRALRAKVNRQQYRGHMADIPTLRAANFNASRTYDPPTLEARVTQLERWRESIEHKRQNNLTL